MKASDMTREQMERSIRASRQELKLVGREIREMLASYGREGAKAPLSAIERFEKLEVPYQFRRKGVELYTDAEVVDMYRDLEYIKSLKTSTVEGAMETLENFGTTFDTVEQMGDDFKSAFWDAYDRVYEVMKDRYKYETLNIMAEIAQELTSDGSDLNGRELADRVIRPYLDILETYGKEIPDDKLDILYTDRLRQLREGYSFFDPWGD